MGTPWGRSGPLADRRTGVHTEPVSNASVRDAWIGCWMTSLHEYRSCGTLDWHLESSSVPRALHSYCCGVYRPICLLKRGELTTWFSSPSTVPTMRAVGWTLTVQLRYVR